MFIRQRLTINRWNGGTSGLGLHSPSYIWPFCPPGGGEDVGSADSGGSPNDPNSLGSPEEPSDPDEDNNQSSKPSSSTPTSSTRSSWSSSPCSTSAIASDCSVLCSVPNQYHHPILLSKLLLYRHRTQCYRHTKITSTASGAACARPTGWSNVVNRDNTEKHQPLGTANPENCIRLSARPARQHHWICNQTMKTTTAATPANYSRTL